MKNGINTFDDNRGGVGIFDTNRFYRKADSASIKAERKIGNERAGPAGATAVYG